MFSKESHIYCVSLQDLKMDTPVNVFAHITENSNTQDLRTETMTEESNQKCCIVTLPPEEGVNA